jgi:tetratricopeptide (TPR) repeat protein
MELAALMARATIYSIPSKQSDRTLAQTLCDQALELARAIGDQPAEAKILWNLLLLNTRLRTNYRHAIGYGEQGLAIARKLNLREQTAYLLNDLSLPCAYAGDPERGEALNLQARQMWREMNILPMVADNLSYAAMIYIALARYDDAIAVAEEAHAISVSIGNVWGQAFSQSWVGEAYRAIGHVTQAIAAMEDAIRTAVSGFQAPLSFTRADLGALYGDLGLIARGIELAELAYGVGKQQADVMKIWTAAQLGHLYLRDGQVARAATYVAEASENITPTDHESLFGSANILVNAELMLAQNDYARVIQACDQFIEYKHSHRLRQDLPNALYFKALALEKMGDANQARMLLNEARIEAESTNARWIWWRILAALAEMENNRARARELRTNARAIITFIADHTPDNLRASFLNTPEVRAVMEAQ